MKSVIHDFLPPVVVRAIRTIAFAGSAHTNRVFLTYQDALKECSQDAYEEEELIEVIYKKTLRLIKNLNEGVIPVSQTVAYSLFSAVNPIVESNSKQINILDFGGACGAHYFQLRALLNKEVKMNWVVVETPKMVMYGRQLENAELSFSDTIEDALKRLGTVDLLHTSGTLQCLEQPFEYLGKLLNCNAKWVLFNRLGLNKLHRSVITIHSSKLSWNGIGELPEGYADRWVKYPFNFLSEPDFLDKLQEAYSIVAKFNDQTGMLVIEGEDITGYGLLCKRRVIY